VGSGVYFARDLIAIQLSDVFDHLLRKTSVRVDRFGLSFSDFAVALVEEAGSLQPRLQRKRRVVGRRTEHCTVDVALFRTHRGVRIVHRYLP